MNLRRLCIRYGDGRALVRALAAVTDSPNWFGLRELRLELFHDQPKELLPRLFRAAHLRGLTRVCLQGRATAPAVDVLAELPALREVSFVGSNFDDAVARRFAAAPGFAGLRTLRTTNSGLTGVGAAALIASPHLRDLVVLNVRFADLRNLPPAVVAGAPVGGLCVAAFSLCNTNGGAAAALIKCPRLSEAVCFDAGANLDAKSVRELIDSLGTRRPAALTMHEARLSDADVCALANWSGAAGLDYLDLWRTRLTTNTVTKLAESPQLSHLNYLRAEPRSDAGRAALKARFGDRADV